MGHSVVRFKYSVPKIVNFLQNVLYIIRFFLMHILKMHRKHDFVTVAL